MEYNKLVAVSGMPGLFELINSKTDGAILRSLDDQSTRFISSRVHNFSHLESIEVYTTRDNVNLAEVLLAMEKAGSALPGEKDADAVKKYFEKVFPDMDFERVYSSDMKKMVKWFDILKKNNVAVKLPEPEEEPEEETVTAEEETKQETVSLKKPKAKKESAPEAIKETPKKTARKKSAE